MKIMVLVPAYNESSRIAGVVHDIRCMHPDFDVVVVNDGSRDNTAIQARMAGATVISHPFNMGYGVAIQTGYKYALRNGYALLAQVDGDGQHDPTYIERVIEPILAGEADFVLGSRFLDDESYEPSPVRKIGMLLFRHLVSACIGQRITDSTSGFQAFNQQVIRFFNSDTFPCDYPDADMLLTVHRAGFRVREVSVRMFANAAGKSMHGGWRPLYYLFKMLLSISVTLLRKKGLDVEKE